MRKTEEFYVGYFPKAPHELGRWLRRILALLLAVAAAIALVLVFAQAPFAASFFEFGVDRDYAGVLALSPYPHLITSPANSYLLAGQGKHGVEGVAGEDGREVRLRGSLITRGHDKMIEVRPETLRFGPRMSPKTVVRDLDQRTLRGEIVDSKCFLGVMNPGSGQVHRDCAARCLSGGLPPLFVSGNEVMLLEGFDVRHNLHRAGVPITLSGRAKRVDGMMVFDVSSAR
jgi:hypothetical protein